MNEQQLFDPSELPPHPKDRLGRTQTRRPAKPRPRLVGGDDGWIAITTVKGTDRFAHHLDHPAHLGAVAACCGLVGRIIELPPGLLLEQCTSCADALAGKPYRRRGKR